jgi:hypothetical protein
MTDEDKIAALEREVAALKEAVKPAPARDPKAEAQATAEWQDRMHQMKEARMSCWTPPSALQEMIAAEPKGFMKGVIHDNRAPTGRPGMIPDSQQASNARTGNVPGSGTGWAREIPLSNPPGVALADKLMDEQDRRDRAELAQRLGALKR